jgi:hypothetical protein
VQGRLTLSAGEQLASAGDAVIARTPKLHFRSVTCAAVAADLAVLSAATLRAAVDGATNLFEVCRERSN